MIYVQSFKDSQGNRVRIGDMVGYFNMGGDMLAHGKVRAIEKSGYHIAVRVEGRSYTWSPLYLRKV